MLAKIGRRRDEIMLTTVALCSPPVSATEQDRERAAMACKGRLQQELAQWPGMPVLTLGATAARTLIPKATLDAIDPPNVPKTKKKSQKERQKAEAKAMAKALKADARAQAKRQKAIDKIAKERLKALVDHQKKKLVDDAMRPLDGQPFRKRKKPSKAWVDSELEPLLPKLTAKAEADAVIQYELDLSMALMQAKHEEANPKPVKPPKHKPVKITDIMSTCFEVDVDGTGVPRPLIPTIHPGSLLRGGGATIGGTHTPDLAFINLYYDASKVDALAAGKDVRLKLNVDTEIADVERSGLLVRDALDRALLEGELSIDLETYVDDIERHHALMAYMARIRTIGLATNTKTISVMWEHIPAWAMSYLQLVLAHPTVTKTFHNGIYDRTVLTANGFTVEGNWEDCYIDSETEFLTDAGWLPYTAITPKMRLGTINADGQLEWQHAYSQTSKPYEGLALVFETKRTRAVVTPNHRMWCRPMRRTARSWRGTPMGPWGFVPAGKLLVASTDTFEVQQTCEPSTTPVAAQDPTMLQLLGVWLADGSLRFDPHGQPCALIISQIENGKASALLRKLAKTLPLRCKTHERKDAWRTRHIVEEQWALNDRTIAEKFMRLGRYSRERRLPPDAFEWAHADRVLLLEALFSGDGSEASGRRFIYRSGSERLADDVQALALSVGWTATNPKTYRPNDICHVFVSREVPSTVPVRTRLGVENSCVTELEVSDRIVCFSVPNETLITRSHGKPAFYGNTLLGHHAAFPGCAHRLQSVTAQFFAVHPWKSDFRNSEETPEGLTKYNALDTGATHALRPAMTLWIKRTQTEKVYALDKKMAEIASKMHLAGMPVSREVNSELLTTFTHNVIESRRAVEAVAEDPKLRDSIQNYLAMAQAQKARKKDPTTWTKKDGTVVADFEARYESRLEELQADTSWKWKVSAGKHVTALLQALGVPLLQTTASGQISTKKDVLEGLVNIPVVRDILTFRENDKLLSTFCLAPGSRVLTTDLRWVPIETLRVDDEVIGFDEHGRGKASSKGPGSKYQRSKVEAISRGELVCYRITTDRGAVVVASEDHLWLARDGSAKGRTRFWKKTKNLQPGDLLAGFGDPWTEDQDWGAGFIAGFLEGEGCVLAGGACFTQNRGPALDHMMKLMSERGFGLFVNKRANKPCVNVYPHGGFVGALRMLGRFRPPRLLAKAHKVWEGKFTGSASNPSSTVVRIERIGKHPVIALRTSTRTFIAEGLLTHNCWQMFERQDAGGSVITHGFADANDRIHPIWSVHKITGRWASSEPVVSNVPKDKWKKLSLAARDALVGLPDPGGTFTLPSGGLARVNKDLNKTVSALVRPNLRRQIKAPPGRVFIGGDFAQIEYRIIALLSGDKHLCSTFEAGRDIHVENARVIWPDFDQLDSATKKEVRERAKPLGYGAMYLAQVDTLHKQLLKDGYNVKLADVASSIGKLLRAMEGVVQWQRNTVAQASMPPYEVRDIVLGRRRTWPLGQVEGTEAVNFGVQSTAAAIMNQGLDRHACSLMKYKDAFMIGQFHDAVITEAWEDDAEQIAVDMKRDFEQEIEHNGYRIPFIFEPKIGTDWSQV